MGRTKTVITIPATLARFTETPLGEQRSRRRELRFSSRKNTSIHQNAPINATERVI